MSDVKMVDGEIIPLTDQEKMERNDAHKMAPTIRAARKHVSNAKKALTDSDGVILRCAECQMATPDEWMDYRKKLRAIINSGGGALPSKPDYPKGTA